MMEAQHLKEADKAEWIERSLLVLLSIGLLIGVLEVLRPFTTALLFGSALATAGWPIRERLVRRGVRRSLAAGFLLLSSIAVVVVPMVLIAPHLAEQLAQGMQSAERYFAGAPELPAWLAGLPLIGKHLATAWASLVDAQGQARVLMEPYAEEIQSFMVIAARGLADSILQVILSLAVATMLWTNGEVLSRFLHASLQRLGGTTADHVVDVAAGAICGVVYGVVGTAVIQAALLAAGLAMAGVPAAAMLGFVGLLLAISQIGAPLIVFIWGGAALWLFGQDQQLWAAFMVVWGVIVSTVDNFLKPWLIGFGIKIPLSLVILGVFGGFITFGFLGLFIGPTLIAVAYHLLQAWQPVSSLST